MHNVGGKLASNCLYIIFIVILGILDRVLDILQRESNTNGLPLIMHCIQSIEN